MTTIIIGPNEAATASLESQMTAILDASAPTDFAAIAQRKNGYRWEYEKGILTVDSRRSSHSTVKPISTAIMLHQVAKGTVALTDTIFSLLPGFTATGTQQNATVIDCLTYLSGFEISTCRSQALYADFHTCVLALPGSEVSYDDPQTTFEYLTGQLDVVCAAVVAAHPTANSWVDLVDEFKLETGLLGAATYLQLAPPDPFASDAIDITQNEMIDFWAAINNETILTPALIALMKNDQMDHITARTTTFSDIGEDWHYGAGVWIESRTANFTQVGVENIGVFGAAGQYLRMRVVDDYIISIGRLSGGPGTYGGSDLCRSIETLLAQWAIV